jgi:hypothetical protein
LNLARFQRHRGLVLAFALASGALLARQRHERADYWHAQLPNFDSYVFVAMAENPRFFTVAPWGYRLLHPALVSALPPRFMVRAFEGLAFAALALSGAALFVFLRRLGHGEGPSLLAVLAFAASGPVAEALRVPFLGEPVALLTTMAFVLAVELGAGVTVLALLLTLAAYAKESALLLAPLVFLARRRVEGSARAVRDAVLVALPAAAVLLLLRHVWTPYVATPRAPLDAALVREALAVLAETWKPTVAALLLGGIAPLAVLGALRRKARPYLERYGYLAAVMVAVSLTAWVNVPSARAVPLFSVNTLRILVYALPFLLPLALVALDRVWPHMTGPAAPRPPRRLPNLAALPAIALLLLVPILALDRYRRVPLHETRDGPLVRTTARETLRAARRLSRGETVAFDPESHRFAWGEFDAAEAHRMRWFLRGGWGSLAHYGTGDIVMHEARAGLLVPCLAPANLQATITLQAPERRRLRAFVNGRPAGPLSAGPDPVLNSIGIPADALFRGDNLLTIAAAGDDWAGVALRRLTLGPAR